MFLTDVSPRKGTRTSSSRDNECAVARPVINGTYSSAVTGPAQLFITNVSRFGVAKSRNGCGSVIWTQRRNKCCRRSIFGSSGTTTPVRFKVVMCAFLVSVSLLSGNIDEVQIGITLLFTLAETQCKRYCSAHVCQMNRLVKFYFCKLCTPYY